MLKPRFLALLLVTALLALSFSQGPGLVAEARKAQAVVRRHYGRRLLPEEMVATVMDYDGPKPNTNTRGGVLPPQDPPSPPAV